jgi:hypothetical protein
VIAVKIAKTHTHHGGTEAQRKLYLRNSISRYFSSPATSLIPGNVWAIRLIEND